jgi:hypothetical protein
MAVRRPPPFKRIDWTEVVFQIERAGYSQGQIGQECGIQPERAGVAWHSAYWANRLRNIPGTQPSFHEGALLIAMWVRVTGRTTQQLPEEP